MMFFSKLVSIIPDWNKNSTQLLIHQLRYLLNQNVNTDASYVPNINRSQVAHDQIVYNNRGYIHFFEELIREHQDIKSPEYEKLSKEPKLVPNISRKLLIKSGGDVSKLFHLMLEAHDRFSSIRNSINKAFDDKSPDQEYHLKKLHNAFPVESKLSLETTSTISIGFATIKNKISHNLSEVNEKIYWIIKHMRKNSMKSIFSDYVINPKKNLQ